MHLTPNIFWDPSENLIYIAYKHSKYVLNVHSLKLLWPAAAESSFGPLKLEIGQKSPKFRWNSKSTRDVSNNCQGLAGNTNSRLVQVSGLTNLQFLNSLRASVYQTKNTLLLCFFLCVYTHTVILCLVLLLPHLQQPHTGDSNPGLPGYYERLPHHTDLPAKQLSAKYKKIFYELQYCMYSSRYSSAVFITHHS